MSGKPENIVPAEFPELRRLCWNRDPARPISRHEAFQLYDRNWRFVDDDAIEDHERVLLDSLEQEFGAGAAIGTWEPLPKA
nr:hypothetical protein [Rhizobium sp. BK176]